MPAQLRTVAGYRCWKAETARSLEQLVLAAGAPLAVCSGRSCRACQKPPHTPGAASSSPHLLTSSCCSYTPQPRGEPPICQRESHGPRPSFNKAPLAGLTGSCHWPDSRRWAAPGRRPRKTARLRKELKQLKAPSPFRVPAAVVNTELLIQI